MEDKIFASILFSSEMYCSLKFEDAKGCPYNAFDNRTIAVLASASIVLGIASLALGA